MTPVDDLTEEEALAIALLLGFEWEPHDDWMPCQWYPRTPDESCCGGTCHSLSCWGAFYRCTREMAVWRFLYDHGVISKIPEPKKP